MAKSKQPKEQTYVTNVPGGMKMFCKQCGDEKIVTLPVPVEEFVEMSRAYTKLHKTCESRGSTKTDRP